MDPKELRGLYEAYSEVYAPQQIDEISQKTATRAFAARATDAYELDDNKSSDKAEKTKERIVKKFGKAAGQHAERAAHRNIFGRGKEGFTKMPPKPTKEEVEQIDELKKSTLGSYVKKASKDVADRSFDHGESERRQYDDHPDDEREGKRIETRKKGISRAVDKMMKKEHFDIFDVVLEFLQVEGYAETLEEAEWLMANVIDEEAIDIILGEAITSEKGKVKAAEMIAARSTPSGRAKAGQGANVATIKHIQRSNRDGLFGTPPNRKVAGSNWPKSYSGTGGTGNKAARRAAALKNEEYMNEAQEARNNPEKYEREQSKKSAPVRGERTPMPPRGDKRREDFEKWYAANVR
jgi:hypothetical protein